MVVPLAMALGWGVNVFGVLGGAVTLLLAQPRAWKALLRHIIVVQLLASIGLGLLLMVIAVVTSSMPWSMLPPYAAGLVVSSVIATGLSVRFSVETPHRPRRPSRTADRRPRLRHADHADERHDRHRCGRHCQPPTVVRRRRRCLRRVHGVHVVAPCLVPLERPGPPVARRGTRGRRLSCRGRCRPTLSGWCGPHAVRHQDVANLLGLSGSWTAP